MKETIISTIAGLVAGIIAAVGVVYVQPEVNIPEAIKGEPGVQGERGSVGYGVEGKQGIPGKNGKSGKDGKSVTVEQVLAALDEREDEVKIEYNLSDIGVGTSTVLSLKEGVYDVSVTNAGSGYFGASLSGHGKNIVFSSQAGHVFSEESITITDDGEYRVNITSDGQWSFDIEKK